MTATVITLAALAGVAGLKARPAARTGRADGRVSLRMREAADRRADRWRRILGMIVIEFPPPTVRPSLSLLGRAWWLARPLVTRRLPAGAG